MTLFAICFIIRASNQTVVGEYPVTGSPKAQIRPETLRQKDHDSTLALESDINCPPKGVDLPGFWQRGGQVTKQTILTMEKTTLLDRYVLVEKY